jgi:hypothetical protein
MARVRINQVELRRVGINAVRKVIDDTARTLEFNAKRAARVGPYATGTLSASITTENHENGSKVEARVGSYLNYAASVNNGAAAHIIAPVNGTRLSFYWRKVGHRVNLPIVHHPGQRGSFYLTDALQFAGIRNGMRVVTYVV